ncbi:hypothetical protein Tsp_10293 [Trichinella spiralis]|uniref:hypothetical protein n=1 Tax=Trichinella spiralis TaxID=6334 RepID=UPI0001EFE1C5|nr:hypothetical protein Tsp_10293 [Trichinella spiralis]
MVCHRPFFATCLRSLANKSSANASLAADVHFSCQWVRCLCIAATRYFYTDVSRETSVGKITLGVVDFGRVHNGMIVVKSCCFTCQSIPALAANCQRSLKLVYDTSRQMSVSICSSTLTPIQQGQHFTH